MDTKQLPSAQSLTIGRGGGMPGGPGRSGSRTVLKVAVTTGLLAAAIGYGAAAEVLALTAVPPAGPIGTSVVVPTPQHGEIPIVHRFPRR